MVRGTFASPRLKNALVSGVEGGITTHQPSDERVAIFTAAERYRNEGVPLVVIAGAEYGTGSSRDWAAKGTMLLGVRAVIARSFERIHRSNLVGMGVLPCEFAAGEGADTLALRGDELYALELPTAPIREGQPITLRIHRDGRMDRTTVTARISTPAQAAQFAAGGIPMPRWRITLKNSNSERFRAPSRLPPSPGSAAHGLLRRAP
jgi:aconitate hydratase